jgi:hypothetical protein
MCVCVVCVCCVVEKNEKRRTKSERSQLSAAKNFPKFGPTTPSLYDAIIQN